MKKMWSLLVLIPLSSQASTNQLEFSYGHGTPRSGFQLNNLFSQEGPQGPEWFADWLHQVSSYEYFGIGGGHFHSGDESSGTFAPNANSDIYLKTTTIMGLARVDLSPNPKLTPYLILGLGWVRNSLYATAAPATAWPDTGTSESRLLADDSKSTLGYAMGLGLDLALTDRLYIGIEGKYQSAVHRSFDVTAAGQAATGEKQVDVPLGNFFLGAKAGLRY